MRKNYKGSSRNAIHPMRKRSRILDTRPPVCRLLPPNHNLTRARSTSQPGLRELTIFLASCRQHQETHKEQSLKELVVCWLRSHDITDGHPSTFFFFFWTSHASEHHWYVLTIFLFFCFCESFQSGWDILCVTFRNAPFTAFYPIPHDHHHHLIPSKLF